MNGVKDREEIKLFRPAIGIALALAMALASCLCLAGLVLVGRAL